MLMHEREPYRMNHRALWMWPAIIVVATVIVFQMAFFYPQAPFRPLITLLFLLFCPGIAFVGLLRFRELSVEITLAIALSFAINEIVAMVMLYSQLWNPQQTMLIVMGMSLFGAALQLVVAYGGATARRATPAIPRRVALGALVATGLVAAAIFLPLRDIFGLTMPEAPSQVASAPQAQTAAPAAAPMSTQAPAQSLPAATAQLAASAAPAAPASTITTLPQGTPAPRAPAQNAGVAPAATAAPAVPAAQQGFIEHTVEPGDIVALLAVRYNTSVPSIVALNPDINPDSLVIGDVIRIPTQAAPDTTPDEDAFFMYTVKRGDTLTSIAKRYNASVLELITLNPDINPDSLTIEEEIRVPVVR